MNEFNENVIKEFRANGGVCGGPFEGAPMILVHHKGAKSGTERVTPLVYQADGDDWVIFASKAGAPSHPHWYHNLLANPATTIEVGTETFEVTTTEAEGDQRSRLWETQKTNSPQFAEYEEKAGDRQIPVLVFARR